MPGPVKRIYTGKDMVRALAFGLLIITLIFIVSPAGMIYPLGSWIFLLFGTLGFYLFNAMLLATSLVVIIKNGFIAKYFSGLQFLGFLFLLIGVATLTSSPFINDASYLSSIASHMNKAESVRYYYDFNIGGGYLGYALATLLNIGGLNYVLSIAFIILGFGLFFFHEIVAISMRLVSFIKRKSAIEKSKKEMAKNTPQPDVPLLTNDYVEDEIDIKPVHFDENPDEQITRIELYSEHADPSNYREESDAKQKQPMYNGGLHEAKFGEEEELLYSADAFTTQFFRPDEFFGSSPKPQPKKAETPKVQVFERPTPVKEPIIDSILMETPDMEPKLEEAVYVAEVKRPSFIEPTMEIEEKPAPAPAPVIIETPAPIIEEPEPEPTPVIEEPHVMTEKDKFEARLSLLSTENKIIIRDLHCDFAEELPPFELPPVTLLKQPTTTLNKDEMSNDNEVKKQIIDRLFQDMRIGAHVEDYEVGPSVTRFYIATDSNVRVSSINGILPDLAKRLGGMMPRFQEYIMGRQSSGLEIPNDKCDTVYFKELMDACGYGEKYKFDIPFGKDIAGNYVHGDLRKFPHMLVAGSTGSGKSIFIHGIIMALIMKNRPEELKLILVDPKRVEMALYKDLPHLLCPIIKDVTQVKVCLDKLIDEMERRNSVFEQAGCTNIKQFNEEYAPENGIAKLPYIVLILDEFADAVDVCKNISEPVARLAQKARSAGIHIVLTTQRPTVDVVNGRIKANLPTTVALWVRTATDSCTILGEGGAENLAGHGDMLVNCPELNKYALIRAQGCMVWNDEIKAVCNFIRNQQNTHYDPVFLDLIDHEAEQKAFEAEALAAMPSKSELRAAEGASKYEMIKEAVMNMEYISISKIQREFGVGFPRAGKIFKQLQDEGIVAPNEPGQETNSKGSKVLIHASQTLSGVNEGTQDGTRTIPNGWDMPR